MNRLAERRRFRPILGASRLEARHLPAAAPVAEVFHNAAPIPAAADPRADATPLGSMAPGETYQGLEGGFYGEGSNQPPQALIDAAGAAQGAIQRRSATGRPSGRGRIGVVAIGQSTTAQWFPNFQARAAANPRKLRRGLFFVNGGQDAQVSQTWASSDAPWGVLAGRVGTRRRQVQVVFLDAAMIYGQRYGPATAQASAYHGQLAAILDRARATFPNLKLAYAFPFHWAGSASPARAVTEPAAYTQQFGIRELVANPRPGVPAVLWGPDVWAQTRNPGLYTDGVHFSASGRAAMARITWNFLRHDFGSRWIWR